jgi:glycine dehydrogenase subunit 2
MIEPTETEDKKTLEEFADAMINIDQKIDSNLDYLLNSPHKTPVRRLNEVMANRELDINYNEIQKK